jgi:hypothetical protein
MKTRIIMNAEHCRRGTAFQITYVFKSFQNELPKQRRSRGRSFQTGADNGDEDHS